MCVDTNFYIIIYVLLYLLAVIADHIIKANP